MKITINYDKLAKALLYTSRAVSAKPNIPVLSNVLLDVSKNGMKLSATNLDMAINMWIPGVVEEEGSITVSAKYIADFVSASKSDNVLISQRDNVLEVKTNKSKANFNTINANEFPTLPKPHEKMLFSIGVQEFLTSIEKVVFACSTDISVGKIQQSGVYVEALKEEENKINFVGLDGFRLSSRVTKVNKIEKDNFLEPLIIPSKYITEVAKIAQDSADVDEIEVFLSENKSQVLFKFEDVEFSIRLLEGPYPDYKKILPDSFTYAFEVKKADLEDALKIANTFARGNLSNKTLFDLDVESSQVKLKSVVAEVGDNEAVFDVNSIDADTDLNAAYNLKFIQDAVSHIKSDVVRIETKGPLAASVFKDNKDEGFLHLLMPLRRD